MCAIVTIVIVSLSIVYFKFPHKNEHMEKFAVTNPWIQSIDLDQQYVAKINEVQHTEVRSLESGYLQNIYVQEGQFVKKNQKMFAIMTT